MFAILLPIILALQANALATADLNEPWVGDRQPALYSDAPQQERLDALRQVIACGQAKLEGAGVPESQGTECAKEVAAYNEVSAKTSKTAE